MTTTEMDLGGLDVSNSHEPSYYEIALTNRQVVVAFVILLTCLVAAFLSGVWIGRESGVRAQEKLALLTHGSMAGTAAGSDGNPLDGKEKEKTEGQALQEFKFFADSQHRAAGQGKQGGGSADTTGATEAKDRGKPADSGGAGNTDNGGASTLADDLHRRSTGSAVPDDADSNPNVVPPATGRAARAAQKNARATPADAQDGGGEGEAQTPAPTPAARQGAAPSPPVAAPRSRPTASGSTAPAGGAAAASSTNTASAKSGAAGGAKNAATSTSSGAAAAAPADAAGDVVIQVFSSADKDQADKVRDTLVGAGFQAFLSPLTKGGQTMYRVRIGPFATRAGAEAVAEKVRKGQKLDTWITPK